MNKRLFLLMLLCSCGLPASCYISDRDMHTCTAMCGMQGVRAFDKDGCHCNSPTVTVHHPDGGQ